jgi:hypothetical protein
MGNIRIFLQKNWLTLLLAVVVIYLALQVQKNEPQGDVLLATEIGTMLKPQLKAAAVPSGTITFCFRLDGREDMHLPALMGNEAQSIYPNGLAGYNWSLSSSSSGQEDYGVLADGTIFVKEAFLKKWGMTAYVELKSDKGGWQPVKMEQITLDGEVTFSY